MEPGERRKEPFSGQRQVLSTRKKILFAAIPSSLITILAILVWMVFSPKSGRALNRLAWESTYTERHLAVPAVGPREGGVEGSRVYHKARHPATKWCEPLVDVPGILEIDSEGRQHFRPSGNATFDVLFIGGSVAAGTFASTAANTYFAQVGTQLEAGHDATSITVFAGGAWKSIQDVAALQHVVQSGMKPNLVVFINGLNDLTNGGTADGLYGERTSTRDGSKWTPLYHAHDYSRRIAIYLRNMREAAAFASGHNIAVLIALQPALFERDPLSNVESQLLAASLPPHESRDVLIQSYARMRSELSRLADGKHVFFLDCSRIFNGETATTFTDMWHFSDFGHQILANELTPQVRHALRITGGRGRNFIR